jgi:hypothetical protein
VRDLFAPALAAAREMAGGSPILALELREMGGAPRRAGSGGVPPVLRLDVDESDGTLLDDGRRGGGGGGGVFLNEAARGGIGGANRAVPPLEFFLERTGLSSPSSVSSAALCSGLSGSCEGKCP